MKALSWYVAVSSPQHGENTAFFSGFPLADFMAETLYRLFPPNFKEKGINHMTQPLKKLLQELSPFGFRGLYRGASFAGVPERNLTTSRNFSEGGLVRGLFAGRCHRMWLFQLHRLVTIPPFSVFPLAGFMAEALYRLSRWNFKKEGSVIICGCFISPVR